MKLIWSGTEHDITGNDSGNELRVYITNSRQAAVLVQGYDALGEPCWETLNDADDNGFLSAEVIGYVLGRLHERVEKLAKKDQKDKKRKRKK